MKTVNVLITSAGTGPGVAVIKALKMPSHPRVRVFATDADSTAAGLYLADRSAVVPMTSSPKFIPELLRISRREKIHIAIPIFDGENLVLSRHRGMFSDAGVTLLTNEPDVIETCNDKRKTYREALRLGIRVPRVYEPADIRRGRLRFPVILKPVRGVGSKNQAVARNKAEFCFHYTSRGDILIQDYVEGPEYTVDCLLDAAGRPVVIAPRERLLVKSGQTVQGRIIKDPEVIRFTKRLSAGFNLRHSNCVQIKRARGKLYLIEINPRYGTGVSLTIGAGANVPLLQVRLALGEKIKTADVRLCNRMHMIRYWEEIFVHESVLRRAAR